MAKYSPARARKKPKAPRKLKVAEPFQIIIQGTVRGITPKERRPFTDAQERLVAITASFADVNVQWGVTVARKLILFNGARVEVEDEAEVQRLMESGS